MTQRSTPRRAGWLPAFAAALCLPMLVSCSGAGDADSGPQTEAPPEGAASGLKDPTKATAKAPDTYQVLFKTTKGDITIECRRAWAPNGADRFYNLVQCGFFTDIAVFRVVSGFVAQFGIHGDPEVAAAWRVARIQDDPVVESNGPGTLTFATAGPNSRTTQLFFNLVDNKNLDRMGFSPFGKVVAGSQVLSQLYSGYGEGLTQQQGAIEAKGNAFLRENYPELDYIQSASVLR